MSDSEQVRVLKSAVALMEEDLQGTSMEMVEILSIAEAAKLNESRESSSIPSGYADLDACIKGGFRAGDFTIVTGIAGEGKTTLCRCFTLNFAKAEIPSLWFSYEMSVPELWESFKEMGAQDGLISFVPITVEQDLAWILAHAKKAIEEKGVKAIFIDTLGDVVKITKERNEMNNHSLMLTGICKALRNFAIEHGVMIFTVAHATKTGIRKDVDKETFNDDVAYSAGIVQTATNVFHVWRGKEVGMTVVKIGKSRRNGAAHGKKLNFKFQDNKLLAEGYYTEEESIWDMKS